MVPLHEMGIIYRQCTLYDRSPCMTMVCFSDSVAYTNALSFLTEQSFSFNMTMFESIAAQTLILMIFDHAV